MIRRLLSQVLRQRLDESPAVALLGPRQVGKTTLALDQSRPTSAPATPPPLYLDLESEGDLAKLAEPEIYLSRHFDRLVILDEVHRVPGLFPTLRGLIDRARRERRRSGLYLLLGSAGLDLLRQSGESLAGRVSYLELAPLSVLELGSSPTRDSIDRLWLRGGFPESTLADSDARSLRWRQDFVRTYLERDIPQYAGRIAAETLRRFWGLLAHHHGGLLNVAQLARDTGIDAKTANTYLDLLVDLLLVRRLSPWHANVGKRLVKSPKVYVRDCGILHALLGIGDMDALLARPTVGASWETFVIENLLAAAQASTKPHVEAHFYRTSGGAEIDLLLTWSDGEQWAIEIKRGLRPKVDRGFHEACADLAPARRFVVYTGDETIPLSETIEAVSLPMLTAMLHDR